MAEAANVTAITALSDLRAALLTFAGEARDALDAVQMEIRRTFDWLDGQLKSWQQEVRRCEDEVFQCQQELARRKMMRVGDRPPDTTEQEKALRKARAKLEYAEEQREKTRKWIRDLPEAVTEYDGPTRQLGTLIEGGLQRACALLERKVEALEEYVSLTPPPAPQRKQP